MRTSIISNFRTSFETYLNAKSPTKNTTSSLQLFSESTSVTQIIPQFLFQEIIRPIWKKPGLAQAIIGDHPDFKHLAGSDIIEKFPITTLFMDIVSSTRLGILYPPEKVFQIKNAFITAAIDIIQAFDGHVHRIMGDAVMAFFGNNKTSPEDAALSALNAASVLQYMTSLVISPKLADEGFEDAFGIRMGVDYGPKEDVLWASYGFPGSNEVTATSFFVDVASKLQHSAPKNSIMLGQSICEFIVFPEALLKVKYKIVDSTQSPIPYLIPNITNRLGHPINYKQFIFDAIKYLHFTPLAKLDEPTFSCKNTLGPISLEISYASEKEGAIEGAYCPCSTFLKKDKWLCFKITHNSMNKIKLPAFITFNVENHGPEAAKNENNGNHSTVVKIESNQKFNEGIRHWEQTMYRGLHYMSISIRQLGDVKFERKLGIFIK